MSLGGPGVDTMVPLPLKESLRPKIVPRRVLFQETPEAGWALLDDLGSRVSGLQFIGFKVQV